MSSRKPGYLAGVIFLALALSSPQILFAVIIGSKIYETGRWPFRTIPGFGNSITYGGALTYAAVWQDQFINLGVRHVGTGGNFVWCVFAIDPETGKSKELVDWTLNAGRSLQPMDFGERFWLFDPTLSYEVIDGKPRPSTLTAPRTWGWGDQRFLLNGQPAYLQLTPVACDVTMADSSGWNQQYRVDLPSGVPTIDGTQVYFDNLTWISCLNQGDQLHLFVNANGRLLYRNGLPLRSVPAQVTAVPRTPQAGSTGSLEPVSALDIGNRANPTDGWLVIRQEPIHFQRGMPSRVLALLIGGQPAVMVLDEVAVGEYVGKVYRFDGRRWLHFEDLTLPFGASQFRGIPSRNHQKSYVLVTTSSGIEHIFAVESTGIRKTWSSDASNPFLRALFDYLMFPMAALVQGLILAAGLAFLMWLFTRADYGFGTQTVTLASLVRRGIARIIDLVLIIATTAGLGWWLTRQFDWLSFVEALNLRADHPTVGQARQTALMLAAWMLTVLVVQLVLQGQWGLTAGKWCCGIRTVRTTLKPCGFARSLVREIVTSVDTCNLLSWTPCLVAIAWTDRRQRLGDLVADTIVIRTTRPRYNPSAGSISEPATA